MKLVAIRILLLFVAAAGTALLVSAASGAPFSLAISPQFSALFFIPVNLVSLWLLARHGRQAGRSLLAMMDYDRAMLGRDLLMGLVWQMVLFIPFAAAINLGVLLLFGPQGMLAGFEKVFAPSPDQFIPLPAWFAWASALLVAVLFPLTNAPAEELTYRGHAQSRLQQRGWPAWLALLVPSIAFGLQHVFLAPTVPGMLVFGLAFTFWGAGAGLIYLRTGRLMPVVLAHLLTNLMFGVFPLVFLLLGIGVN